MNRIKKQLTASSFCIFMLIAVQSLAQREYFVYLQTENNTPFYVSLNQQIFSSTAAGYVILPKLTDGTYEFSVGFAGKTTEFSFIITINNADQGYLLKDFGGEKGLGLFNLQTFAVQLHGVKQKEKLALLAQSLSEKKTVAKDSVLASDVASNSQPFNTKRDSTLTIQPSSNDAPAIDPYQLPTKVEPSKVDTALTSPKSNETIIVKSPTTKIDTIPTNLQNNETRILSAAEIAQLQEEVRKIEARGKRDSLEKALKAVPITTISNQKDSLIVKKMPPAQPINAQSLTAVEATIFGSEAEKKLPGMELEKLQDTYDRIGALNPIDSAALQRAIQNKKSVSLAPLDASINVATADTSLAIAVIQSADTSKSPMKVASLPQKTTPLVDTTIAFLGIDSIKIPATSKDRMDTLVVATKIDSAVVTIAKANKKCSNEASNSDIDLLKMLMKAEKTAEESLDLAKKLLKIKCITTSQVQDLATLFTSEEDLYALFDLTYRYVSNPDQFSVLQTLLKDPYFINRFKAMLR